MTNETSGIDGIGDSDNGGAAGVNDDNVLVTSSMDGDSLEDGRGGAGVDTVLRGKPSAVIPDTQVVSERQSTHGDFKHTAEISHGIKMVMRSGRNWHTLPFHRKESFDMMAVKMARILSGDSGHPDHWLDIAGYAELGGKK